MIVHTLLHCRGANLFQIRINTHTDSQSTFTVYYEELLPQKQSENVNLAAVQPELAHQYSFVSELTSLIVVADDDFMLSVGHSTSDKSLVLSRGLVKQQLVFNSTNSSSKLYSSESKHTQSKHNGTE